MSKKMLLMWLMLIFITACGTENKEQSANEDQIIVYTTLRSWQITRYLAAFNAQYPSIEVTVVDLDPDDLQERLLSEKENPVADVVWSLDTPRLLLAQWNDILFSYIPAGYERIETEFRDTVHPPFWVGIQGATNVFCVHPEKLKELGVAEPRSWQDLLDPAYKGQIAMPNPKTVSTGYAMITGWLLLYGETAGWEYINQLDKNIAKYTAYSLDPCDMVADGKVAIGITHDDYALLLKKDAKLLGRSLEVIFPSESLSWQLYGAALVKKEQVKPAAKTFLDWSISDSALDQYAKNYQLIPARTDQARREGFPKNVEKQLLNMEFPWAAANKKRILTEWTQLYE